MDVQRILVGSFLESRCLEDQGGDHRIALNTYYGNWLRRCELDPLVPQSKS